MNKLKDILLGSLGIVGYILWFIIGALVMFAPLIFLDFSFLGYFLLTMILFIPCIGAITNFILWIWSFTIVVSEPIDGWSIAYFIIFAIYGLSTIIPTAISIIASIIDMIVSMFNNKSHDEIE